MSKNPFSDLPRTAPEHFKLYFYAAVSHLIQRIALSGVSPETTFEEFPFLRGYWNELVRCGITAPDWWEGVLPDWETTASGHLPLRALREAGDLDHAALMLLLTVGLVEEDARFGVLFENMEGVPGQQRPTVGLLNAWFHTPADAGEVRTHFRQLLEAGVIQVTNPDAPRAAWILQAPALLWDALRGEKQGQIASWAEYREPSQSAQLNQLILTQKVERDLAAIPALLESGEARALIVRGPQHNGRRTVAGAVARTLKRGVLAISGLSKVDDERWRLIGPLATLLHAMPLVVLDPGPGETIELPGLKGYEGPVTIVLGIHGGVSGARTGRALTLTLDMPDADDRRRHWFSALGLPEDAGPDPTSGRFRMTSGNIRRAASLAVSYAALEGRANVTVADAQQASRALNRQNLDMLAERVDVSGDWSQLAVAPQTLNELYGLESRCRHRERLRTSVSPMLGPQLTAGVRALFTGPSGTGKTLAARLFASALQMDLYRFDLSSIVNKYIGETEKNLNRIFSRAEELDVILLLDEGDALLTQRTAVNTSNDRYANLETNYLLQRLESYEGILIVTTNAGDRIDSAFQRRMDVVVDFRPPDPAQRLSILQLHLPVDHIVDADVLREIAARCVLSGGQIRNAALHASLLALDDGGIVTSSHLEAAVQREYRKSGAMCPLRRSTAFSVLGSR